MRSEAPLPSGRSLRRLLCLSLVWGALMSVSRLGVGCAVAREQTPPTPSQEQTLFFPLETYLGLKDELTKRCVPCHGPDRREGRYLLSTYHEILRSGSDATPNAIPADAQSLLLTALSPTTAAQYHQVEAAFLARLRRWVLQDRLAYFRSSIHRADIHLPGASGFHGALLQQVGWDASACQTCHGQALDGGASGASCLGCHDPADKAGCASCHSVTPSPQGFIPPRSQPKNPASQQLHEVHFRVERSAPLACGDCHQLPRGLLSQGHLDGQVQVRLGGRAGANARWDASTRTCQETACHGSMAQDAKVPVPSWRPEPAASACNGCHGDPPTRLRSGGVHPADNRCSLCHQSVDAQRRFILPALHINGRVEVSFKGTCQDCHGDDNSAAPPKDLDGKSEPTRQSIGAHRIHLAQNSRFRAIPCSACHLVPTGVFDKGHIDTPRPAEVLFSGVLIRADGLKPSWDRASNTCSQVYCHGASLGGGPQASPPWTQKSAQGLACNACHGDPPRTIRGGGSHTASRECHRCHKSVDAQGKIKDPQLHINGRID